ncbi:hypothetical protein OGAPHI_000014 [Ogataea philodendri]|uniref:ATPase synthesis protein 25 n=1 Tax=Ogataea philodendri TaxID=1378263 RepID=A0A9P8PGJ1_9ASCO|nr:uncharacterized protein OGAPHI_000014 [Ogataea philodendri]KAH3671828.1 hypothetical protein OGAPHI_000014 [Ogataea philodendri]
MSNIEVFDLRNPRDPDSVNEGAQEVADFMVVATGKSAKHLQKATLELNLFVKHQLKSLTSNEGLLSTAQLAKFRRRLLKRGKKGPSYAMNDYGAAANTWVMVDCKDDNIAVHLLTEERRDDLDLESLWAQDKSKYENRKTRVDDDNIFSGFRFMHTMRRPVSAGGILTQLAGFRSYSQVGFDQLKRLHLENPKACPLDKVQNHLLTKQAQGTLVTSREIAELVELILQSAEFHDGLTSETEVFSRRTNTILHILSTFNPILTEKDITELLPTLVIAGSQADNENFVKLNSKEPKPNPELRYSVQVNHLYRLYESIFKNRKFAPFLTQMDLIFLTIFANRNNWVYMKKVVDSALARQDFVPVEAALNFLSISGTPAQCLEFIDAYLPYLRLSPSFHESEHKSQIDSVTTKATSL